MESWIAPIPKCRMVQNRKGRTTQKEEKRNQNPLEVELDLSGEFHRGNMSRPSLPSGKEAHLVSMGNFKLQDGLKMYIQLPDYDNAHVYGLAADRFLCHVDLKIYANPESLHGDFGTSLVYGENHKGTF